MIGQADRGQRRTDELVCPRVDWPRAASHRSWGLPDLLRLAARIGL